MLFELVVKFVLIFGLLFTADSLVRSMLMQASLDSVVLLLWLFVIDLKELLKRI